MFTALGRGYVGNSAGDFLSEIDAISLRETARIKVGIAPMGVGIVPGDAFLLASNSGSNTVSVVDLGTRTEIAQVPVGREPRHMAVNKDGTFAYVAVSGGDYISRIDISALSAGRSVSAVREVARISVGSGAAPYSVALTKDGLLALAANNQADYASLIDTTTDSVIANIDLGSKGGRGAGFAPDGLTGFISIEDVSELVAIDVASRAVVSRFPTNPGPRGFTIDEDTFKMYIAGFSRTGASTLATVKSPNAITVINLASSRFTAFATAQPTYQEVLVGAGPCSVTLFKI